MSRAGWFLAILLTVVGLMVRLSYYLEVKSTEKADTASALRDSAVVTPTRSSKRKANATTTSRAALNHPPAKLMSPAAPPATAKPAESPSLDKPVRTGGEPVVFPKQAAGHPIEPPHDEPKDYSTDDALPESPQMAGAPQPVAPDGISWFVPSPDEVKIPDKNEFRFPIWKEAGETGRQYPMARRWDLYSLDTIMQRQFPVNCGFTLEAHIRGGEGMFSTLNQLMGAMSVALRLNRTFIPRGPPTYYAPRRICYGGRDPQPHEYSWWNCLFKPITNCNPQCIKFMRGKKDFLIKGVRNIYQAVDHFPGFIRDHMETPPLSKEALLHNANIMAFIFRPIDSIVRHARKIADWLGLTGTMYASVHIRRTDKNETDVEFPTSLYVEETVSKMPAGTRTVFVMTDSDHVLEEIEHLSKTNASYAGIRFVWSKEKRSTIGQHWEFKAGTGNPIQHAAEFLADILVAANSTLFAGTCGSHIGRAMMALMTARTMLTNNSIMLDQPLCKYHALRWFNFNIGNLPSMSNATHLMEMSYNRSRGNVMAFARLQSKITVARAYAQVHNVSFQTALRQL
eukprot:NODE_1265_length_1805_cov_56.620690_g1200_i0.p1 GENE.NODE_1265_length_1805_cov_56.620690_g1200_i0~~NODE_1265_length_1805_cov_56.620690_g1200_i0.p1  ORF type:complete len:568 (-),score=75.84 NODE_1265_length_1805_cov_56.620690_g1200_i0:34-1737(-)